MRRSIRSLLCLLGVFAALLVLHGPLLRLPYFWDEAGYYIPAALDFYRRWLLVPQSTVPTGHTPLVIVYLALAWRIFGFSAMVTRAAMILVAAATVVGLYELGRYVARGASGGFESEVAGWGGLLLAVSPLFFAQSSLVHLDLAAALFTTLAVLALLRDRMASFALWAVAATLCKETAVVVLPVAWLFAWRRRSERRPQAWAALAFPLLPLASWAIYYHHVTRYWTGNPDYLEYNLYSTLNPPRVLLSLLRRLYETFIAGFNWLAAGGAILGAWWSTRDRKPETGNQRPEPGIPDLESQVASRWRDFQLLLLSLAAAYVVMLSIVGGAVLPRYLLPVFPVLFLAAVLFIWRLPRGWARGICLAVAAGFVGSWFLNPPYPFPFEDNLAYVDFVRLHQQGASFLAAQGAQSRILTAWPASDELTKPELGYVTKALRVVPASGLAPADFNQISRESFDLIYLYSRKWEPADNWLIRFSLLQQIQKRYFDYEPQASEESLREHYSLVSVAHFEHRGQWVRVYAVGTKQ